MPTNKITDLVLRNLKPTDKVQMLSDGGGLVVRVRTKEDGGAISFMLSYRLGGKLQRITLKAKTLAAARKERDQFKAMLKQGIDPRAEQKLIVERNRLAQIAEQAELARIAALTNVNGLFDRWVAISVQDRKDLPEIHRLFAKDVLPIIGALSVQDVRKGHISEVINALKLRGVKHMARNALKLIRQMFRFAVDQDFIDFDPTAGLSIVKVTTAPTERDRVLSEPEIKALSCQMPSAGLLHSTEAAIWIMLATCCRVGEISKAEWKHISFDLATWTIPAENSKNGKPHTIYLSRFALQQFQALTDAKQHNVYMFPDRTGTTHVCDKSLSKQIDSRQNDKIQTHRTRANHSLVLSGGKWTPHDLRRTGATLMGMLGISPDVIEKCLNHTEENALKRIYQRQELKAEQAEAWQLLGERLELLVDGADNVVTLNKLTA